MLKKGKDLKEGLRGMKGDKKTEGRKKGLDTRVG